MAQVDISQQEHVLHIHITRPEKYNALSLDMYHSLGSALRKLEDDPELRAGVISAEGRNFTAGVELDQWAPHFGSGKGWPLDEQAIDPFGMQGEQHSKPLIIAVQGYCFTWGVELLLNTEIRVAASDTQFQMLEVQRGLFPCGGASFRLPQQVGWSNAQRMLLTGDRWTAEEALRWGMVQEVVEPGSQIDRALALAQSVAAGAPLAVQALLKSSRYSLDLERDAITQQIFSSLAPVMQSDDAEEGVQSFLERRAAVFQGK